MVRKFARKSRRKPRRNVRKRVLRKSAKVVKTSGTLVSRPGNGMVRQPFPPNFWTCLTFTTSYVALAQTGGVGTPAYDTYRLNSLYDPDQSGSGIQPRYFDTLCGADNTTAPYGNYRVHAATVDLTVFPTSTNATNSNGIIAVIPRRSNVGAASSYDEMMARAYGKSRFINTLYVKPQKIKLFSKIKTHLGHKDLMDVDDAAAAYNSNPNEEVYADVIICAIDPAGNMNINYSIKITYFVQFYGLNDVADS